MKLLRWHISFEITPRPLPPELRTALAQLEHTEERLKACEENVKTSRTRLETVYRKVYRDEEMERGDGKNTDPQILKQLLPLTREIKPGDPPE